MRAIRYKDGKLAGWSIGPCVAVKQPGGGYDLYSRSGYYFGFFDKLKDCRMYVLEEVHNEYV